jgi:hypothetical protein
MIVQSSKHNLTILGNSIRQQELIAVGFLDFLLRDGDGIIIFESLWELSPFQYAENHHLLDCGGGGRRNKKTKKLQQICYHFARCSTG